MIRLLTTLLIVASATTAQARIAQWSDNGYWKVLGDPDGPFCVATSYYSSGKAMHIAKNSAGWNLSFSGVNAVAGRTYYTGIRTKYSRGVLVGTARDDQQVIFAGINDGTLINLAVAPSITVEEHTFSLRGSADAIKAVNACYNAVSGRML